MAPRNRGRQRLHDLNRTPPNFVEKFSLREEFNKRQSPIVIAILGQSLLEIELDLLLRPHFKHNDDQAWGRLTSQTGPLSSFAAKIIAAHAFGIFNDLVRDNLNIVRDIRNAFAHSNRPLTFSHKLVVQELQRITLPEGKKSRLYKTLNLVRELATDGEHGAYESFRLLCLILNNELFKKSQMRLRARTKRQMKSQPYRHQMIAALMGLPPATPIGSKEWSWWNHSVAPNSPTLASTIRGLLDEEPFEPYKHKKDP
jgi:DNA-binding MltR family transcriptional regulator